MSLVVAEQENIGTRLDIFVSVSEGVSRSAAQELISKGDVTVNGKPSTKNYKLREGDRVEITLPPPEPIEALPQDIPVDIVYEDEHLLVVNKPQGMVVHPAPGNPDGTLVNALLHHCAGRLSSINGKIRPGIVHRIDKDTAGLLIVAKTDAAHTGLAEQIAAHSFTRRYRTIVVGNIREDNGTIDKPIGRSATDRKKFAVTNVNSKPAVTHYRVIERLAGYTHLELTLETGRTHQIRVHMAYMGHPVIGDPVYGNPKHSLGLRGQCLFAEYISFTHPITGEIMSFGAELPDFFKDVLRRI
ncbi:MAG: RluA family pseudouridine synthase [Clostridia bacterium]|nr:RluA family pseudouridine synthase [Clostridia bacterium]